MENRAPSLAKKSTARASGARIAQALKRVAALSPSGQDAIANITLETLDKQPSPAVLRFRALIEQKYVSGLSAAESAELQQLEAGFNAQDESFYITSTPAQNPPNLP